jgi:putative membrane protein insertion efficiency factor
MLKHIVSIPRYLLIGFVRAYQLVLSPHLGASCRYTPTCSEYAILAINKYGAAKGFILATHRIARCNPWGGHGDDPPVWYSERNTTQDPPLIEHDHDPSGGTEKR